MSGVLRYWAGAKAAAGVREEPFEGSVLADVLADAATRRGDQFALVLKRCSFLVDGVAVGSRDHGSVVLPEDAVVEVLPPFAGG